VLGSKGLRALRREDAELREIAAQIPSIASRKAAGLMEGMRANQKVRNKIFARSPLPAITPENLSGRESAPGMDWVIFHAKRLERGVQLSETWKQRRNFSKHNVAHGQARFAACLDQEVDPISCVTPPLKMLHSTEESIAVRISVPGQLYLAARFVQPILCRSGGPFCAFETSDRRVHFGGIKHSRRFEVRRLFVEFQNLTRL